ncbi:hypothetical protein [Actinomadura kijaniata]|uniref:hypothetical protein n=1 Tax=Actinomadura kijaniata TaxID=46161 RepID=UPI00082DC275|nr:hypothetical protein [Actinomadura kijaniata]
MTALALAAGRLTVLSQDPGDPALLIALDPATGKPGRKSWLRYDVNASCRMLVVGGRHLMVNAGSATESVPAIMAF